MVVEEGSPMRRSGRERVQTPKAVEFNMRKRGMRDQNGSSEDETEDIIKVDEGAPAPPWPRRTEISAHFKGIVVATKIRALSTKTGKHQTTEGAIPNQWTSEKGTSAGNTQMKVLTDLVKSLVKTMEE